MSLVQFTNGKFNPTSDQQNALVEIDNFLNSDEKVFLLKGYAGTGKTTLTKYLADYLSDKKMNYKLWAPTGRAARIIEEKTGHKSSTIHKGIYDMDKLDEEIVKNKEQTKYKFIYRLLTPDSTVRNVYIIDEASMISDVYSEDNFFVFGSGHLLTDLIHFIVPNNIQRRSKLIFIGDPAQLPPVGDKQSGALSSEYLKNKFDIHTREYELTHIVRQEKNSGILDIAFYLREQLWTNNRKSFQLKLDKKDTQLIDPDQVAQCFQEENTDLNTHSSIVISYSNKSAFEYNLIIRKRLFDDPFKIEKDDILIINQNNYNYDVELMNGTLVNVAEVGALEVKSNLPSFDEKGNKCKVTHKFRSITILVHDKGGFIPVKCLILENFLYSNQPKVTYAESVALYLDFKFRNPKLKTKTQ